MGSIGDLPSALQLSGIGPDKPRVVVNAFLLQNPDIDYVRFQWVDYAVSYEFGCGQVTLSCLPDDSRVPIEASSTHLLYPDWSSLRILSNCMDKDGPKYASVMCSIIEEDPGGISNSNLCLRIALRNVVSQGATECQLDFLIGFEIEFVVLQSTLEGSLIPFSSHPGTYSAAGLRTPSYKYLEECVKNLSCSGIPVREFHVEGNIGQYEITLAARPPLEAVDDLVAAHDIIRCTFARHGYTATMSPKPVENRSANGSHIHVSIHPPRNQEAFLAGLLQRLPAICAFSMPSISSYRRCGDYQAGTNVSWGTQNRQTPVRKLGDGYWEVRCADATANMYLAVAAILGAGLLGSRNGEPLRWEDMSFSSGSKVTCEELPRTISKSLDSLERISDEFREILSSKVTARYLYVKRNEVRALEGLDSFALSQLLSRVF
ncbi:hypothetical protein N7520_001961 [Penicillium odoratum]|uniref:uncharacterized protein n=1 Tax=Penicillium odoratum TaxID=1167516 RepID=UPI002548D413|nr:uncharacterized protein N7520_001961 [Penicillium odoratum]KAJ5778715.1 hypothetical protein N7520_001961 [Penicillium odoratum]